MTQMSHIKLSRAERNGWLRIGRRAGDMESARHAMEQAIDSDPRWQHLPYTVISDYAWSAARFCFPNEAKYI